MNSVVPSIAFVVVCICGCARLDVQGRADAGAATPPSIVGVEPAPGMLEAPSAFRVAFSAAMDEGVLLSANGRSEALVLVGEPLVERAAAAIERPRLSAEERALLVSATAFIEDGASAVALAPEQPLPAGVYFLLASSRLRDAAGRRLSAAARFRYDVAAPKALPKLLAPAAGAVVAANLARVRVQVPAAAGRIAIVAGGAEIASAPAAAGIVEISLCPAWSGSGCAALRPGQTYSLALDGAAVGGQAFTAARCPRLDPPRVDARLRVRDTSLLSDVQLDWPARVSVRVGSCPGPGCDPVVAEAICAPDPCDPPVEPGCRVTATVSGLAPATSYDVQLAVDDDEGHALQFAPVRVTTVAALPKVRLSEVMASPPQPAPRSDGEYVELWNDGNAPADVSALALAGGDGVPRSLSGVPPPEPVILAPGRRALAVGASFDASRYALPAGVPVLRAATQRLLGRGLADEPPPAISLLARTGGMDVELSTYPGGTPHCVEGASIEMDGPAGWKCGRAGGSPGTFP